MNGEAFVTVNDGIHADAVLVRRFRQAQTKPERAAVFAEVVRQHRDAVLGCCAEQLWPDEDAAVAAAGGVFIAASLAMADSAKLASPGRLRGWLLGIAARGGLTSGMPAGVDDINWEAVHADAAASIPDMRDLPARRASLRHWLKQIVATLPEARQRLYDMFVARGMDSRNAALELGTNVAEVRRLRRENRQAILRAFEVTALAAAEAGLAPPGIESPGCAELRQVLADAPHDGRPYAGGRRDIVVLPAAVRLTVTRHLSQCVTCQHRRDDCMARWAPDLLPILAGTELNEQVMEDLHQMPAFTPPRAAPGARRSVAFVGTAGPVVARQAAVAGAGLLGVLLLLAFVWPGFLHGTAALVPRGSTAPSSQDPSGGGLSGTGAPQVTGTSSGAPRHSGRQVRRGAPGLLSSLPPAATGSLTVPSSPVSPVSPVLYTVQPSTSPTSSPAQPTSVPTPTSFPPAPSPSPSPSASRPTPVPSAPQPTSPVPSTPAPTTPPPTASAPSTPAPSAAAPSASPPAPSPPAPSASPPTTLAPTPAPS